MKKYKFTILKHILNNGSVYYTCKVKIIYPLVWTIKGIDLFLSNFKDNEKHLDNDGFSFWSIETEFKTREDILSSIDEYISKQELIHSEQIKSVETEIIWR
jgi:hypothetical protein